MAHKNKTQKKEKKRGRLSSLIEQIKKDKKAFLVYSVLRLLVIAVLVRSIFLGQWESAFTCVLTLILLLIPSIIERQFKIEVPTALEIVAYIFIFSAEILGEIECYYLKYPFWDTMLHTVNGFMFAAFGFCLVDIFNRHKRFRFELSPIFCSLVAFCFSMTIGVMWEFFEFGVDMIMHYDTQKDTVLHGFSTVFFSEGQNKAVYIGDIISTQLTTADGNISIDGFLDIGLHDTMMDMFVNFVGAVIFSMIGYIYIKQRGKGKIASSFIPVVEGQPQNNDAPTLNTEDADTENT